MPTGKRTPRATPTPRGFTLIEVIIATAIAITLIALAWVSLQAVTVNAADEAARNRTAATIRTAQSIAIESGTPTAVLARQAADQWVLGTAPITPNATDEGFGQSLDNTPPTQSVDAEDAIDQLTFTQTAELPPRTRIILGPPPDPTERDRWAEDDQLFPSDEDMSDPVATRAPFNPTDDQPPVVLAVALPDGSVQLEQDAWHIRTESAVLIPAWNRLARVITWQADTTDPADVNPDIDTDPDTTSEDEDFGQSPDPRASPSDNQTPRTPDQP